MDRSCAMPPMRTRLLRRLLLWCRHPQAQQCRTPRMLLPAHLLLLAQNSAVRVAARCANAAALSLLSHNMAPRNAGQPQRSAL